MKEFSESEKLEALYSNKKMISADAALFTAIQEMLNPEHEMYEIYNEDGMFDPNPVFLESPHGLIEAAIKELERGINTELAHLKSNVDDTTDHQTHKERVSKLGEFLEDDTDFYGDWRSQVAARSLRRGQW